MTVVAGVNSMIAWSNLSSIIDSGLLIGHFALEETNMKSSKERSSLKLSTESASKFQLFSPEKLGVSNKGGPTPKEQLFTLAKGHYWMVLNSHLLNTFDLLHDQRLRNEVNALKHSLQSFGPNSPELPDCRSNKGKAEGYVFHGHCKHSGGTTFVLEWSEIDAENKIIALTNFGKHENFRFSQTALSNLEIDQILHNPQNIALFERAQLKRQEAELKVARIPSRGPGMS